MAGKKNTKNEIKRLKKQLKEYQKQYQELIIQSPVQLWHDEYFDNQLKVLEVMIAETKKQLAELKRK